MQQELKLDNNESNSEFLSTRKAIINDDKDLIRPKTDLDPTGRGMKPFKKALGQLLDSI